MQSKSYKIFITRNLKRYKNYPNSKNYNLIERDKMSSNLADALLTVRINEQDIIDILWKNAKIGNIDFSINAPSEKLIKEFLQFLPPEDKEHFLEIIPGSKNLNFILNESLNQNEVKALLRNSFITEEMLDKIAALFPTLKSQTNLIKESFTSQGEEVISNDELNSKNNEIFYVYKYLGKSDTELMQFINSQYQLKQRNNIISAIAIESPDKEDFIIDSIIGLREPEFAGYVDSYVASHLNNNQLIWQTNLDLIATAKNDFKKRISRGALNIFESLGADVSKLRGKNYSNQDINKTDLSMLKTLTLAGVDNLTLSTLILSTYVEMDKNDFVSYLKEEPITLLQNFLIGGTTRKPSKVEVVALLSALSKEEKHTLGDNFKDLDTLAELPWYHELAMGIPNLFKKLNQKDNILEVFNSIYEIIGVNSQSWEFLLVVSNEWEDDFYSLITASQHI